jgi:hypothetical protein
MKQLLNYVILGYIATNCRTVKSCKNVSYVIGHELTNSLLFVCVVSVSANDISMWVFEV